MSDDAEIRDAATHSFPGDPEIHPLAASAGVCTRCGLAREDHDEEDHEFKPEDLRMRDGHTELPIVQAHTKTCTICLHRHLLAGKCEKCPDGICTPPEPQVPMSGLPVTDLELPDEAEWEREREREREPEPDTTRDAAYTFLNACGLKPSPDAVGQLVEVFLPCLRIMCDPAHPWDPDGDTWRKAGVMGALADLRKKFERYWERTWVHGMRHDDSGFDGINYWAFSLRAEPDSGWADWGNPANVGPQSPTDPESEYPEWDPE